MFPLGVRWLIRLITLVNGNEKMILFFCKNLRLFPDLRWEKEVRCERTAMKGRRSRVKLGG